jgi:hypothetical protein
LPASQPIDCSRAFPSAGRRDDARDDAGRVRAQRHPDLVAIDADDQEIGGVLRRRVTRRPHERPQLRADYLSDLGGIDGRAGAGLDNNDQRFHRRSGEGRCTRRHHRQQHTNEGLTPLHTLMSPQVGRLFNPVEKDQPNVDRRGGRPGC